MKFNKKISNTSLIYTRKQGRNKILNFFVENDKKNSIMFLGAGGCGDTGEKSR
jgi:hypothetical protein